MIALIYILGVLGYALIGLFCSVLYTAKSRHPESSVAFFMFILWPIGILGAIAIWVIEADYNFKFYWRMVQKFDPSKTEFDS